MEKSRLLELRKKNKKVKPRFIVKDSVFSARVKQRWRLPRGRHSRIRQMHRGAPALVAAGYGTPRAVRGLHSSGLRKVIVHNTKELVKVNPAEEGAVLASGIGRKKLLELITLAIEKKIRLLSVKDAAKKASLIKESFEARKKSRKEKIVLKGKKEEEKKKKVEEKKKKDEEEKKTAEAEKSKKDNNLESSEGQEQKEEKSEEQKIVEKTITKRQ